MALSLKRLFGTGGSDLTPEGPGKPSLLRQILAVLAGAVNVLPDWSAELTVTTHVVTMATAGMVVAVEATTASATGVKQMQSTGSPAQGYVQVAYASGVATLTFNATDAVTGCKVKLLAAASDTFTVEA